MCETIIITDITPRLNADYGLSTPIRSVGAYRISTSLHNAGYTSRVIDFFFYMDYTLQKEILKKIITDKTLFIGFSNTNLRGHTKKANQQPLIHNFETGVTEQRTDSIFYFWENARKVMNWIRNTYPHVKMLLGGGQLSATKKNAFSVIDNYFDYLITGDADESITKLASHLKFKTQIKTYSTWRVNGNQADFKKCKVIHSEKDYSLSTTHFDNLDIKHEKIKSHLLSNEWLFVEMSRGCIFNCYFCSYKHVNNKRPIESIKKEILDNYYNFGITKFRLIDDTFNDDYQKVKDFTSMLQKLPFEAEWHTYARADLFRKRFDMIDMMYESGCKYLKFGLESTNDDVLKAINKSVSHKDIANILEKIYTKTNGDLYMHSNFILGLPLETKQSIFDMFSYIKNSPLTTVSFTTFFRDKFYEDEAEYRTMAEFGKKEYTTMYNMDGYHGSWKHGTLDSKTALEMYNEAFNIFTRTSPYWVGSDLYPILRTYGIDHKDTLNYLKKCVGLYLDDNVNNWYSDQLIEILSKYINSLKKDLGITIENSYTIPDLIFKTELVNIKEHYKKIEVEHL